MSSVSGLPSSMSSPSRARRLVFALLAWTAPALGQAGDERSPSQEPAGSVRCRSFSAQEEAKWVLIIRACDLPVVSIPSSTTRPAEQSEPAPKKSDWGMDAAGRLILAYDAHAACLSLTSSRGHGRQGREQEHDGLRLQETDRENGWILPSAAVRVWGNFGAGQSDASVCKTDGAPGIFVLITCEVENPERATKHQERAGCGRSGSGVPWEWVGAGKDCRSAPPGRGARPGVDATAVLGAPGPAGNSAGGNWELVP